MATMEPGDEHYRNLLPDASKFALGVRPPDVAATHAMATTWTSIPWWQRSGRERFQVKVDPE